MQRQKLGHLTSRTDNARRVRWLVFFLGLLLIGGLTVLGCEEGKNNSSGGITGGGKSAPPPEHINTVGKGKPPTKEEKTQRTVNQLNNYMLSVAAANGAPNDLATAKTQLREMHKLNWANDAWGNALVYQKTGDATFELYSAGADGQNGTADDIRPQ